MSFNFFDFCNFQLFIYLPIRRRETEEKERGGENETEKKLTFVGSLTKCPKQTMLYQAKVADGNSFQIFHMSGSAQLLQLSRSAYCGAQ